MVNIGFLEGTLTIVDKNEGNRTIGSMRGVHCRRGRGTVWATLALAAALTAVPSTALAAEATDSGAANADEETAGQGTTAVGQGQVAPRADQAQGASSPESQKTTVRQALAASDQGTYEQAGLHALAIAYVDEDGNQIAPTYHEALVDGDSYNVPSPEVGGYALVDAAQSTVAGTVSSGSGDVSVTVTYKSTIARYKVVHERQVSAGSGEYRVSETETFMAPSGTKVTAACKTYDGYDCITNVDDRATVVTPDGKATIVIKYDVVVPSYSIYFTTNGSYVAPVTGRFGDAVEKPADPERAGYSFKGWDTTGDGVPDELPKTIPEHDTLARAVWAPAQADYQVQYYLEESGDEYGGEKHYKLDDTRTLTGATDSTAPQAPRLETTQGSKYQYYQYASETSAQIAGDGSTVLEVYYDLKPVTVYYYVLFDGRTTLDSDELMEKRTLTMFQKLQVPDDDAALALYKKNGGSKNSFRKWAEVYHGNLGLVEGLERLQESNVAFDSAGSLNCVLCAFFADNVVPCFVFKDFEGVAAGDYPTPDPIVSPQTGNYYLSTSTYADKPYEVYEWRCSESHWDGEDPSAIKWGPWHKVDDTYLDSSGLHRFPSPNTLFDNSRENAFEVHLARRSYDVTYYSNGKVVGTSRYRYGEQFIAGSGVDSSALKGREGLVFGGWAASPDAAEPLTESIAMPGGNYSLYALWKRPDVSVTFDSTGGTPVGGQTVAWRDKATEPLAPTREGYEFGGWYFFGGGSQMPARFSFDQQLENDVSLVAAWRMAHEPTKYTVRHVALDGTVLAEQVLDGFVGQTVSAFALAKSDARREGYAYVDNSGATIDLSGNPSNNVIEFRYANEPQRKFTVHMLDRATGLPVAPDVDFDSSEPLIDLLAPSLVGYHVLNGGRGYLSVLDGGQELTFWYAEDTGSAEQENPIHPGNPSASALSGVAHRVSTPSTGDPAVALPFGIGAIGAALAALCARIRRRHV